MLSRFFLPGAAILFLVGGAWPQDSADDTFRLARNLYRDTRDYATAAELFAELIRNYPDAEHLAEARLMLAHSYRRSQRCDLAIKAYEEFYQEHPDHLGTAEARRERAACLAEEERYLEAAQAHEEIQRRYSASEFAAQSLLAAATNYTRGQQLELAGRTYARVFDEYAENELAHSARYQLALLLFAQGQSEAAQRLLVDIDLIEPAVSQAPSALLFSGRIHLFVNNFEAAKKTLSRLQRRFPSSAHADSASLDLAIYLFDQRQFSQAGDAFERAYARIRDPQLKKKARLGLADARRQSGQAEEALKHYRPLLKEMDPDDPDRDRARLGLAITYGQVGQTTTAVGIFQELIQGGSESPTAIASTRELGALYQRQGDHTRAISWYRRYLQVATEAPDRFQVQFSLAQIYARSGYYEEALPLYRELAETNPELAPRAQFGLARTFEQRKQPRTALREYMVFLERFPGHRQEGDARTRIEYLSDFTITDPEGLGRAVQQALIDELRGQSRQQVLLELGKALYEHRDLANAVGVLETYVASYPDIPSASEAQYFLAQSLLKLGRQRQLEQQPTQSDSLQLLGLQELRLLAQTGTDQWAQQAQVRLVEVEAAAAPNDQRHAILEKGLLTFINESSVSSPHRPRALAQLGDAQRHLGQTDVAKLEAAVQTYRTLQRQYPQDPLVARAHFGLGMCHANRGESAVAVDSLTHFLQSYPGHPLVPQVLFALGGLLLERNQPHVAIARYQELLLGFPTFDKRSVAQHQLAEIHFLLGENAEAIALFSQLADSEVEEDTNGHIRRRLAQAYHHSGQYQEALDLYQLILRDVVQPAAMDSIYWSQGHLLAELGSKDEAVDQFLRLRDRFPTSPLAAQATQQAGHLLFDQGAYDRAHQAYATLLEETDDEQTYGRATLALFRLQRLDEGRKRAKTFSKRFGNDGSWPARFQLEEGQYYLKQNNFERALKIFRQLEKKGGSVADEAAYYASKTLWQQNGVAPNEETGAKALEAASQFIKTRPDSPFATEVHALLGNYYYALNQYLMAAGSYRAIIDGSGPEALKQEAIWQLLVSYEKAYEYDAAHRTAMRLMRDFPDHPKMRDAQLTIGTILKEKGQYAKAIDHLEQVLEWAEGNDASLALFYMGQSYQNLGEYRKAIETFFKVNYYGGDSFTGWITSADYQRAQCHESLTEFSTAVNIYQRIIQREGSDSPLGEMAKDRIEDLRARGSLN